MLGTKGVSSVLRSPSGAALRVPWPVMTLLLGQCAVDGVIYPPEPREVTRKDVVRVDEGPLAGFTGICQRTTRDRVWILLSLFGRQSEVGFTREQVELIA
jgi:transcription antitermination factor NusG